MFDQLKAPFPPDRVSWRVGSTTQDKKKGLAFGYIDARDVMDRLDDVCGPGNWQNRYSHTAGKTVCDIGVKVGDEWVWKADGAGDTDVEAEKGALSDAFKRAAVRWGIGRYLYDIPATWVEIEAAGRSFKIKESEFTRLGNLLARKAGASLKVATAEPQRDTITSGQQPQPSKEAREFVEKVGLCGTVRALDNYGATIAIELEKLNDREKAWLQRVFLARRQKLSASEADTTILAAG